MKKGKLLLTALCMSLLLTGCDLWMDGHYHNASPHMQEQKDPEKENIRVSSYMELRNAMEHLVEACTQKTVLYTEGIAQGSMDKFMEMAVAYVRVNNPIGAYALESVKYDLGTSTGVQAVAIEFTYNHSRSEILQIKHAATVEVAENIITAALDNYESGVVLQIDQYVPYDFSQLIESYVERNPWKCMEMPKVAEMLFPRHGPRRVVELSFSYQNGREAQKSMQETVSTVFASAELYVRGDAEEREKFSQLYSFLMERYDYKYETSATPAYSLLRHGVGDAKAFAMVYGAMCRQAGLDCEMVPGTRDGERWFWNRICIDGEYFYVDLLRCTELGAFSPQKGSLMTGYVWDFTAFPKE